MNINIGEQKDPNQISNPDFYANTMKIMDDARAHNRMLEMQKMKETENKKKKPHIFNSFVYAMVTLAIIFVLKGCGN